MDLTKQYGTEYPAAVVVDGIRIPLWRESRFSRHYHSEKANKGYGISRFMDGSASITLLELQREWPTWPEYERLDFCQSCSWLHQQYDFPDMLRFIMQHAGRREWSALALSVGLRLPLDEAFDILLRALRATDIGHTCNITQAIAITKHPEANDVLRRHLQSIWAHEAMWDDDQFVNWVAYDATTCIAHLIELGAQPADFDAEVRRLSEHVCSHNRDSCRNFLSKNYSWLQ